MDENTEVELKLTVQQINVILGTLSEAPYRVAQPLITAIQQQAQAQFQPVPETGGDVDQEPEA